MTTATEQLQTIADAWAQRLGVPTHLFMTVYSSGYCTNTNPRFNASIGGLCGPEWSSGNEIGMDEAMKDAESKWRKDGAPTDFSDRNAMEKLKLKARAAELGLRIVEDEPNIDPVKDL